VRQAGAIVIEARRALRMIALVLAVWLGPSAPALSDARASGAPEAHGVAAEGDGTDAALRVAAAPAEPLDLTVTDGRITARLESAKLSDVAASVFEQTEIEILFIDQIDHIDDANTGPTVSDSFEALPLEEGLRRLYAGYNFVPVYGQQAHPADAEPKLVRVMILPSAVEGESESESEPGVDAAEDREAEEAEAAALTQAPTPQEVLDDLTAALQAAFSDSLDTAEDEEVAAMLETLLEHDLEAMIESAQGSDPGESPIQQLESLTEQLEEQLQSAGTANPGADPPLPSGGGLPIE
jgi:hypothetical protein